MHRGTYVEGYLVNEAPFSYPRGWILRVSMHPPRKARRASGGGFLPDGTGILILTPSQGIYAL